MTRHEHSRGRRLVGIGCLLLVLSCGGSDPNNGPAEIEVVSGQGQQAVVLTPVAIPPAVKVTDERGDPISGVTVTFQVTQGGGQISGATPSTNDQGLAAVGSWTLGQTSGAQTLTASVQGLSVPVNATAISGSAFSVVAVTTTSQSATVSLPVPISPAVRVEDQFGNGVPGIEVAFEVTAGGGSVVGDTVTTGVNGVATVGSWTTGPVAGVNTLVATVQASGITNNPRTFTATAGASQYTIDVRFISGVTPNQQAAFTAARLRLEDIITGDVSNVQVNLVADACVTGQPSVNEVVDDLVIFADIIAIDGAGGILGRAGPCLIRGVGSLPIIGVMQFDVADLNNLEQAGRLSLVILHEMMHVLGFGTTWTQRNVISGIGGVDPIFTGANANASFQANGGNTYPGNPIPVENTGGLGTRDSHWRETVFKNELMTGTLNPGSTPLSAITANQFADIGYAVNPSVADPFTITPPFPVPGVTALGTLDLGDDVWRGPLYVIDAVGHVLRVR